MSKLMRDAKRDLAASRRWLLRMENALARFMAEGNEQGAEVSGADVAAASAEVERAESRIQAIAAGVDY